MPAFPRTLLNGLRLGGLLAPVRQPFALGPGTAFALAGLGLALACLSHWLYLPPPHEFNPYGLQSYGAACLLNLMAAWLIARLCGRERIYWTVAALLFGAGLVLGAGQWAFLIWGWPALDAHDPLLATLAYWTVLSCWWLAVLLRLGVYLRAPKAAPMLLAVVAACALIVLPGLYLEPELLWQPREAQSERTQAEPDFDPEAVMYAQPRLMRAALAQVKPHTPGQTDLYLLAFAGDGAEGVFRNEVEFVEQQFSERFDAAGRTLVLENHPTTVAERPLATLTNLETALAGVARKMDPDEDVLLLFLTSHGSAEHELYVALDPLPLNQVGPEDLAAALAATPIRWKVIVISACYAGGFIDALKGPTTMVIAAARADRTSFGCGSDSELTWFGKAFFTEALNQTASFHAAFDIAAQSIAAWEDAAGEQPSEPQIATTAAIEAKLDAWRRTLDVGPPIAFVPAVPASTNAPRLKAPKKAQAPVR